MRSLINSYRFDVTTKFEFMARSLNLQSIRRERHKSLIECEMCFSFSFKDSQGEWDRTLS